MTTGVGASAGLRNDAIVAFGRLSIAARYEGPKGRVEHKKKARRNSDAPSNKTYGNCLLGLHCSQNDPAENRAVAGFVLVAALQQAKSVHSLSTGGSERFPVHRQPLPTLPARAEPSGAAGPTPAPQTGG